MRLVTLALLATALSSLPAAAGPIFSDNFGSGPEVLNWDGGANWSVSDGTVDLIASDRIPSPAFVSSGFFVDLDGSNGTPGLFSTQTTFDPGTYTLTFDLAGNNRNDESDTVIVSVGGVQIGEYTVGGFEAFAPRTLVFTTLGGPLEFQNSLPLTGPSNEGALLDNVKLSVGVIPEPATLAVFSGIALAGLAGYRRRKATA